MIEFEKLTEKVHIYKNLLPDYEELVLLLKNSQIDSSNTFFFKDWRQWDKFGKYVYDIEKENNIKEEDIKKNLLLFNQEKYFIDKINKNFYLSTNHYLEFHSVRKNDDWEKMGPSFAKYEITKKEEENAMVYHTDYQKDRSGDTRNFAITCTMYLNDDYDGGELIFKIRDQYIMYKPKAGDIMVFPSGHPDILSEDCQYEHAVTKVSGAEKYFIRCFYKA
jgi:hypothetical protein